MSEARVMQIRKSIEIAKSNEQQQSELLKHLDAKIPELHRTVLLPSENKSQALVSFVILYIEYVPELIETLERVTQTAGMYRFIKPFVEIVEDCFVSPPDLALVYQNVLQGLIRNAYLTHRLFEEFSDRIMLLSGVPLIPVNMTVSNVIVYDIIGDSLANELDRLVNDKVKFLFSDKYSEFKTEFQTYLEQYGNDPWYKISSEWPCFVNTSSVDLKLKRQFKINTLH